MKCPFLITSNADGTAKLLWRIVPEKEMKSGKTLTGRSLGPIDNRPRVEVYDTRHLHTPFGQYITDYYVETLLAGKSGLRLYGFNNDWCVDSLEMDEVRLWLRDHK